jgi:hypothetical protein
MRGKRYYPAQPPQLARKSTRTRSVNADIAASEGGAVRRKVTKLNGSGGNALARNILQEEDKRHGIVETNRDPAHIREQITHISSLLSTHTNSSWTEVETEVGFCASA